MPSWGPGVHCWTPSPEHGARHVVGVPKKRFGEGVKECPNLVSPLVCITDNTYQVHPNQFMAELVPDPRSHLSSFFRLFIPLPLPLVNTDCARISLGNETIRIHGPVLAHRLVDKHGGFLSERDTQGSASAEGMLPTLSPFPGQESVFPLSKQDQERLVLIGGISAIPGLGTIPLQHISSLFWSRIF